MEFSQRGLSSKCSYMQHERKIPRNLLLLCLSLKKPFIYKALCAQTEQQLENPWQLGSRVHLTARESTDVVQL